MKMTSRERFLTTMQRKEPDTVPILDFLYSRPLFKDVLGYVPDSYDAESVMNLAVKIGYDAMVIPFGGQSGFNTSTEQHYQDEWGTTYEKQEETWPTDGPVDFPIKSREDMKNYVWPDVNAPGRVDGVKTAVRIARENNKAVIGGVRGPFSAGWFLTGFSEMLIMFYEDRELVDEVLTGVTDFFIKGGEMMAEAGVDALQFADDYGSNTSPFCSPDQFREIILPHTRRLIQTLKKTGLPVMMHSDGHIMPLLHDIVEAGICSCHPIERAAGMELSTVKKLYGDKIGLIGNVNNKTTLVTGSSTDVEEEVKECIRAAAPGGGYVLASDHSVHDDIPNENIFAMYEAGRKFGKYPISI